MYNKKDIEKTLIEFNYFIDEITLSNFIKNWKIDPIYEDEDGVEFYDNIFVGVVSTYESDLKGRDRKLTLSCVDNIRSFRIHCPETRYF